MPESTKEEAQKAILAIAKQSGVEDSVAKTIAEKCWDDYLYNWKPYGGATSFAEIDSKRAADKYSMAVDEETYALRSIIENITSSDELGDTDAKSAAIIQAANDYKSRVNSIALQPSTSIDVSDDSVKTIVDKIKSFIGIKKNKLDVLPTKAGMKVYQDKEGKFRWLSFSSNAFEDYDAELFSTKALEEAVEYADKSGERGPLMFFHIPGTEVGQCDYQGIAGRFLVESGTFNDTPLGAKALEYLRNTDDDHQVSIGYEYKSGDEIDGTYDWVRIRERSFLPEGTAANPWTSFQLIGDKEVDERHYEGLVKVFGKEFADGIVKTAEERTKELEESVRFKAKKNPKADAEDAADGGSDDDQEDANGKKMPPKKKEADEPEVLTVEHLKEIGALIADLSGQVAGLKEVLSETTTDVEGLKAAEAERVKEQNSPRFDPTKIVRPTESKTNVIDESHKELVDAVRTEQPTNPALNYLYDIIGQPAEA